MRAHTAACREIGISSTPPVERRIARIPESMPLSIGTCEILTAAQSGTTDISDFMRRHGSSAAARTWISKGMPPRSGIRAASRG